MLSKKEQALIIVPDLTADYLYYNRKEDEELSVSDIENLFNSGELTVDEVVEVFKEALINGIG